MFANNRIDKLNGRIKYEIISIKIRKYNKIILLTPLGTKNLKKFKPPFIKPIIVIPKKTETDKIAVNHIWLVIVNPYGNNPYKLLKRIKKEMERIRGKYIKI